VRLLLGKDDERAMWADATMQNHSNREERMPTNWIKCPEERSQEIHVGVYFQITLGKSCPTDNYCTPPDAHSQYARSSPSNEE